jgi:hypothetical protein
VTPLKPVIFTDAVINKKWVIKNTCSIKILIYIYYRPGEILR